MCVLCLLYIPFSHLSHSSFSSLTPLQVAQHFITRQRMPPSLLADHAMLCVRAVSDTVDALFFADSLSRLVQPVSDAELKEANMSR